MKCLTALPYTHTHSHTHTRAKKISTLAGVRVYLELGVEVTLHLSSMPVQFLLDNIIMEVYFIVTASISLFLLLLWFLRVKLQKIVKNRRNRR